ncbi:MAG: glycosyltransferase family 39 protein [Xanthobacteraceae bacterium]|nr:glycosyltransferase family 39 protein [Xanthobacteraceae bacterium]
MATDQPGAAVDRRSITSGLANHPLVLLVLLAGVAALVRGFGISAHPMYDEAASWTFARLPWAAFCKVMWDYEGYMVLYYLLLRVWVHLGDSETVLRGLSLILGVATIPAIYDLGRRLYNPRTGLAAAALLSLHAFHVLWSQQARSYTLLCLLLVVSTSLLVSALRSQARTTWGAYVVVATLACYSHILAVPVLAAQWLWVAWLGTRAAFTTASWAGAVTALGALTLAAAPMMVFAILHDSGQEEWVPALTGGRLLNAVGWLAGGTGFASGTFPALLAGSLACCVLAGTFGFRSFAAFGPATLLLLGWLLLPPAILVAASLVKPILVNRYLVMCVPALVLLTGFAIDRLLAASRSTIRWCGVAGGLAMIALYAQAGAAQYREAASQTNPFREMTRYIVGHAQPGDAVIFFTPSAHLSFRYYARDEDSGRLPKIVFPDFGDAPSGAQPIPTATELRTATTDHSAVWLVLNLGSISFTAARRAAVPTIVSTLSERFAIGDQTRIEDFLVIRFVRL